MIYVIFGRKRRYECIIVFFEKVSRMVEQVIQNAVCFGALHFLVVMLDFQFQFLNNRCSVVFLPQLATHKEKE